MSLYAVIEAGGKQYRVSAGQKLKLEKMPSQIGEAVVFDKIFMVGDEGGRCEVGTPLLSSAKVNATVLSQGRHPKILIIKMKRRKHHMKRMGHRQYYTEVLIDNIERIG